MTTKSLLGRCLTAIWSVLLPAAALGTCYPAPTGLVSWWPADADPLDFLGGNNGVYQNGATSTPVGLVGGAFSFDGVNDCVSVPDASSLDFGTGDFSVTLWVRFNDLVNGSNGIVHKDNYSGSSTYNGWLMNICDGCAPGGVGIEVRNVAGSGPSAQARWATSNFVTQRWYHLAATRGGGVVRLYVDGVLRSSTPEPAPINVSNSIDLRIGSLSPAAPQFMNGMVDEVQIWSRALSGAEIVGISSALPDGLCGNEPPEVREVAGHVTSSCDGPIVGATVSLLDGAGSMTTTMTGADGGYHFSGVPASETMAVLSVSLPPAFGAVAPISVPLTADQTVDVLAECVTGTDCNPAPGGMVSWWPADVDPLDSVGGNDGVYSGAATSALGGVVDGAFFFDGSLDYITVPDDTSLDFGTGEFSVALWVRFNDLESGSNGIIHKDNYTGSATYNGWLLNICNGCSQPGVGIEVRNIVGGVGPDISARLAISNFSVGSWYHIGATRGGGLVRLYVNGVLSASAVEGTPINVSNNIDLRMGSLSPAAPQFMNGSLDEVQVWNRALLASEMAAIHTAGASGLCGSYVSPVRQVAGRVTSDCEGPLAGVTVSLTDGGGADAITVTGADGSYTFLNVPASETAGVLTVMLPSGYQSVAPIFVALTADQTVDVTAECLFVSVTGTVSSDCQGAEGGLTVSLAVPGRDAVSTATASDGSYDLTVRYSEAPGDLSVTIPERLEADVPPGGQAQVALTTDHAADFTLRCRRVNVSGIVSSVCNGALLGITVDLLDAQGQFHTTTTDASGAYAFADLLYSDEVGAGEVSISIPLGYEANTPGVAGAPLTLDQNRAVDFSLDCLDPAGAPRSMGYWKHQANVYLSGRGNAQESQVNMTTGFPTAIFQHFHENTLNSIHVAGVTYSGAPAGPLDLATIGATLTVNRGGTMLDRAKQQYLALLLNLASGKLLTSSVVTADGGTASQIVQFIADLINDGDASNDELAKNLGDTINNAQLVATGLLPLDQYGDISYRESQAEVTSYFQVSPNPRGDGPFTFSFGMPVEGETTLEVYDVSGRRVALLVAARLAGGEHQVSWDGTSGGGEWMSPGVYFAQLTTPSGTRKVKLIQQRR